MPPLNPDFDIGQFILDQNPELAFFNAIRPFNTTRNRRRFNESQFDTILNRFKGQLGGQAAGGGIPTLQFNDFLQGTDFNNLFFQQPQQLRGFGSPRTRFLFGF